MGWDLVLVAAALLTFGLVSRRLHGTVLSPAIFFVTVGLVVGTEGLDLITSEVGSGTIQTLAEVTLALVLFTDAASIETRRLVRETGVPVRLLLVGLPLTIVAGTLVGLPLFPGLGFFEVAVLAILLAPTDAALGEPVVADPRLPSELRQGLNVESGLNDGICVPLLFGAIAAAEVEQAPTFDGSVFLDLLRETAVAASVGVAVGVVTALVFREATRRSWVEPRWAQLVPLSAIVLAYAATAELGGSGFVAAFAAGLAFRRLGHAAAEETLRFSEELGYTLSAVTFFVLGAVVVGIALDGLGWRDLVYAVLSLTVVRMVPVAVAFLRTGAGAPTVAFAGWFGPRGLATIVFALIIVEESEIPGTSTIVRVAMLTVLLSVFAHGATAPWLTARYAGWVESRSR